MKRLAALLFGALAASPVVSQVDTVPYWEEVIEASREVNFGFPAGEMIRIEGDNFFLSPRILSFSDERLGTAEIDGRTFDFMQPTIGLSRHYLIESKTD